MREIKAIQVTETVRQLITQASFELPVDVLVALQSAYDQELSPVGKDIIQNLIENARQAPEERLPLCQDCGVAVFFLEVGQDLHIVGGSVYEAITEGVKRGYADNYLRKSMVSCPFGSRTNTGDNSPPVIHTDIVSGDKFKISFMAKGGGAENMSRLFMLKPGDGRRGVIQAVVETVETAGGSSCPPIVVGVGIGGTAEKAMTLAKKSLLRSLDDKNPDGETAALEDELLGEVNKLGIGPLGLGGTITALAVKVESVPSHIASLPVAVNLQCHSARHAGAIL